MTRWGAVLVAVVCTCAVAGCVASGALALGDVNGADCPAGTEASAGFRVVLPDCRAYEVVSQANSGDVVNFNSGTSVFPQGSHLMFLSALPIAGGETVAGVPENVLATRTAQGWQQRPLEVPQGEGTTVLTAGELGNTEGVVFTDDFSQVLLMSPFQNPLESPRLDETTGAVVYDLALDTGDISPVSLPDSGALTQSMIEFPLFYKKTAETNNGWGLYLDGASEDGSKVFFSTTAKLPTASGTAQDTHQASGEVYERAGGHTYLVGVLPDGEVPVCGAEVGQSDVSTAASLNNYYAYGAIAPTGANVVFHAPGEDIDGGAECTNAEAGLFLREVNDGVTVKLPGGLYLGRAGTGAGEEEKIITGEGGLFVYHVGTGKSVEIASKSVGVVGYSASGRRVYYLGPEEGIYLYEEGVGIAKLVPGTQQGGYKTDVAEGHSEEFVGGDIATETRTTTEEPPANAPAVTPDGNYLMFVSHDQLSSYKNCAEVGGQEQCHAEVYLYDASTGKVRCVSCSPTGAEPAGNANLVAAPYGPGPSADFVSPSQPLVYSRPAEPGREPVLRAVFETTEALVPQDVNGTFDVYEWEGRETEGCSRQSLGVENVEESPVYSKVDEGCLFMLSSGTGQEMTRNNVDGGSHLLGASEGLADIYIQSGEPLVRGVGHAALDNTVHIFDVREDGGFPYVPETKGCESGVCRAESEATLVFGEPASVSVIGAGNPIPSGGKSRSKASLTRGQKLARALKACKRRKDRHRRALCVHKAQAKYGVKASRGMQRRHRGGTK